MGLYFPKTCFPAYEQSPAEVRKWLKEEYPRIRRMAQKHCGTVLCPPTGGWAFAPIRQLAEGKSFAPKGKTPVLKKTGNRFYLNEISAISNQGHLVFMVVDSNFNGVVFIRFLNQLIKSFSKKVFLIADSHPVHLGKKGSDWLLEHSQEIEMFPLPGYSPELNPVEYFNQDLKTNVAGKARPRNKEQLKKVVETFSKRKKKNSGQVKKYFQDNVVRYAS